MELRPIKNVMAQTTMAHRGDIQAFWLDAERPLMHPSCCGACASHNLYVNTAEISSMSVRIQRKAAHSCRRIQSYRQWPLWCFSDLRSVWPPSDLRGREDPKDAPQLCGVSDERKPGATQVLCRVRPRENQRPQLHLVRNRFIVFAVDSFRSRLELNPRSFAVTRSFQRCSAPVERRNAASNNFLFWFILQAFCNHPL